MWISVEELVSDLGLPASSGNHEAVEKTLKQQIKTVHPDVTKGGRNRLSVAELL